MPGGMLAVIMEMESSGNNDAVSSLGERGLLQVTTDTLNEFKLPDVRSDPEGNIFAGCLKYNVDAARIVKRFPYIGHGTTDQWLFARCVSAIGIGATTNLLKVFQGGSYSDFINFARINSGGKTLTRIEDVVNQYNIGQEVIYQYPGYPTVIPQYVPYYIPKDVQGLLHAGSALEVSPAFIGLVAVALATYLIV